MRGLYRFHYVVGAIKDYTHTVSVFARLQAVEETQVFSFSTAVVAYMKTNAVEAYTISCSIPYKFLVFS